MPPQPLPHCRQPPQARRASLLLDAVRTPVVDFRIFFFFKLNCSSRKKRREIEDGVFPLKKIRWQIYNKREVLSGLISAPLETPRRMHA